MTPFENAMELSRFGLNIVPVHYPVKKKDSIICSCKKGCECHSKGKHPIPFQWQLGASRDNKTIEAWWKHDKRSNVGVVTGATSGIFVLDVDTRHNGMDSLDNLQVKHGKLPDTALVMTGGGGYHFYFKHPGFPVKNDNRAKIGEGLDVKGEAGFVVGPGSLHESGAFYDWEASSHPEASGFQSAPDWLLDAIRTAPRAEKTVEFSSGSVAEGGRNVFLASVAGALRFRGIEYQALLQMLLIANDHNCKPPLDPSEVAGIALSYAKRPMARCA